MRAVVLGGAAGSCDKGDGLAAFLPTLVGRAGVAVRRLAASVGFLPRPPSNEGGVKGMVRCRGSTPGACLCGVLCKGAAC